MPRHNPARSNPKPSKSWDQPAKSFAHTPRWIAWIAALTVAVITFLAFVPALHGQFLDWDDAANFVRNNDFRGLGWANISWMFSTFMHGHYQPITWLTLAFDCVWGQAVFGTHPEYGSGLDPRAFHFTNNLLHSINAALVYLLALRLLVCSNFRDSRIRSWSLHVTSAFAALLFSVHPLRVENVAWITERRDLVSALFLLLTVLAYLRGATMSGPSRWRWLVVSMILYTISLLSKVSGVPLPVVLIMLDWYPLRRFSKHAIHSIRSVLLEKLIFFIIAGVFALIAIRGQAAEAWLYPLIKHSMDARIVQSFYGLAFYVGKTLLPTGLLPLYELHMPLDTSEPRFAVSIGVVLLTGMFMGWCALKRKWPGLIVAVIAYVAFLGPVLGLFQNGPQLVADRYSYLPAIGLMIALAGGALGFVTRNGVPAAIKKTIIAIAGVLVIALSVLTWRQTQVWRDTETLWSFLLARDQDSAFANNGLGVYLSRAKSRPDLAIPHFQRAMEIDPYHKKYRENLRFALRLSGQMSALVNAWVDEAQFSRKLTGRTEYTAPWHFEQGHRALTRRDFPLAQEHFLTSLALDERQPQAHHNLAAVYEFLNRPEDAVAHYRRAVELDRSLTQTHLNLAGLLRRLNRTNEAIAALNTLLQVDPNNAPARAMLDQLSRTAPQ